MKFTSASHCATTLASKSKPFSWNENIVFFQKIIAFKKRITQLSHQLALLGDDTLKSKEENQQINNYFYN